MVVKAKFSKEVKIEISKRDKCCIICYSQGKISVITDFHHAYYGPKYANYGESRNYVNQGVGLCSSCHYEIHHGVNGLGQKLRKFCMDYLKNFYGKENRKVESD